MIGSGKMRMQRGSGLGRRGLVAGLAGMGVLGRARAQTPARRRTLVLGLDIGDTVTFDPARQIDYTPPLTLAACYDTLVSFAPGQYEAVIPSLATAWERTPEGMRFTLRGEARFASGNRVTPDDVVFSVTRLLSVGAPPAHYLDNIAGVSASGPDTVDIALRDPALTLLPYLAAPTFAILERAALASADLGGGEGAWLGQNSAGSGTYVLRAWQRRGSIELVANPHAWRGPPAYDRILIRHIPDGTAQMRALQRGDIDAAFNLGPAQLDQLEPEPGVRIQGTRSLDMVYLGLTGDATRSKPLALREARQAVAAAIDYDDLIGRLLGGKAARPASFLPIGVPGSRPETTAAIGYRQNLDAAQTLLAEAGLGEGFALTLSYADVAIAGLAYDTLARKLRDDLGRVGIKVTLVPMNPFAFRDAYVGGTLQAALAFWTSPVVADGFWARAAAGRIGGRLGLDPPPSLTALIGQADSEADPAAQAALWLDYQKAMISLAHEIVLFQPDYHVGIRRSVGSLPLTAAGWMADLAAATPG